MPGSRQVMDAGEHPDGGADRLLAIEDLTQGLRREEGQAEQPGPLMATSAAAPHAAFRSQEKRRRRSAFLSWSSEYDGIF